MSASKAGQQTQESGEREQIDWAAAEIRDGALTVPLAGDPPKRWVKRFEAVLTLLLEQGSGDWGKITVSRTAIKVGHVREGTEQELRHLLESVLLQVNSDIESAQHAEAQDEASKSADERDPRREADERIAERFRTFAQ